MNFEELYDKYNNVFEQYVVKRKRGQKAIEDLLKADQDEIYALMSYYDGRYIFGSEDDEKEIVIKYDEEATDFMFLIFPFMRLNEILDAGAITCCEIALCSSEKPE